MSQPFSILLVTDTAATQDRLRELLGYDHALSFCSFAEFEHGTSGAGLVNLVGRIVVLDATTCEDDAIRTLRELSRTQPGPKTVVLGPGPDLRLVARALVYRATRFATQATPPAEWRELLTEAWRGDRPTSDSLMGRVRARLPVRRDLYSFALPHGKELNLEEAADECRNLGLTTDEIASQLRIDASMVATATKSAKGKKKELGVVFRSLISTFATRLPSQSAGDTGANKHSTQVIAGVMLLGICTCVGWMWVRQPSERTLAGLVMYNNVPLECGLIRLQSVDGGRILAGEVRGGRFSVKHSHGSHGGAYRVTVTGYTGEPVQIGPVVNPLGDRVFEETTTIESVGCDDHSIELSYAQTEYALEE